MHTHPTSFAQHHSCKPLIINLPSGNADIRHEVTVISNIYSAGLPPVEAAAQIVEKVERILRHHAAGNRLEGLLTRDT